MSNFHAVYEIARSNVRAMRRGEDVSKAQRKIDRLNAAELRRVFSSLSPASQMRAQATMVYLMEVSR